MSLVISVYIGGLQAVRTISVSYFEFISKQYNQLPIGEKASATSEVGETDKCTRGVVVFDI